MATKAQMNAQIQKLIDARDRLRLEVSALQNQIVGIETALRMLQGEDGPEPVGAQRKTRQAGAKGIILSLLSEHREAGLGANDCVDLANRAGHSIDRASVSSLLSRLKREGVLHYDKEKARYMLLPADGRQH